MAMRVIYMGFETIADTAPELETALEVILRLTRKVQEINALIESHLKSLPQDILSNLSGSIDMNSTSPRSNTATASKGVTSSRYAAEKTIVDYVEEALRRLGHPGRAKDVTPLVSSDFPFTSKYPLQEMVRQTMGRFPKRFTRVDRGVFGLPEWARKEHFSSASTDAAEHDIVSILRGIDWSKVPDVPYGEGGIVDEE